MKTTEELKIEQYEAKAKLHQLIEYINGKEYFSLSMRKKILVRQQMLGIEIYLDAITNMLYNPDTPLTEDDFNIHDIPECCN